jgi:hypothetical protein
MSQFFLALLLFADMLLDTFITAQLTTPALNVCGLRLDLSLLDDGVDFSTALKDSTGLIVQTQITCGSSITSSWMQSMMTANHSKSNGMHTRFREKVMTKVLM